MCFIYHIYYSFYGLDRTLKVPNERHGFYTPILADDILGTTLFGYIIGCIYYLVTPITFLFHIDRSVSQVIGCIAIAFSVFLFFLIWRKVVDYDVYSVYFEEYDNDPDYPHKTWNVIAFFIFIIAIIFGVNSVCSFLFGDNWVNLL